MQRTAAPARQRLTSISLQRTLCLCAELVKKKNGAEIAHHHDSTRSLGPRGRRRGAGRILPNARARPAWPIGHRAARLSVARPDQPTQLVHPLSSLLDLDHHARCTFHLEPNFCFKPSSRLQITLKSVFSENYSGAGEEEDASLWLRSQPQPISAAKSLFIQKQLLFRRVSSTKGS